MKRLGALLPAILAMLYVLVSVSPAQAEDIDARRAHALATSGQVVLVDIRTPGEWRSTGVGGSAIPETMHAPRFLERLDAALGGDRSRAVALICATGSRSARVQRVLADAGFARVYNVADGMMGSRAGPGWLKAGLPVRRAP